ncbi:MAG: 2-phospho-L-lactate guanylyltransferase [Woeseiaceae bacterium]
MTPTSEKRAPTWAILPVKQIGSAKQRLSNVLSNTERQELFRNMLGDVLAAVDDTTALQDLLIVTRDSEVRELARKFGARVLVTDADQGQSVAVTEGAKLLSTEGVKNIVTLAGDVPLMSATEIDMICASMAAAPCMTLVPSRDDTGTNSIACSPPHAIPFAFGAMSFPTHLRLAQEQGVDIKVLRLPAMALDIDTAADLVSLLEYDATTAAQNYLLDSGIAARLERQGLTAEPSVRRIASGGAVQ